MPVRKGDKAPAFSLFDTDKKERSLSEFLGKKTLLAFYPGAFTGVCTKEMCTFRDSLAELGNLKAQVVGISVDSPFANKTFKDVNRLDFPLLSDFGGKVSSDYVGLYESFAGLQGYRASRRAVVILDEKGTVTYVWVTENPGTEPDYTEVKKALA
jgi:peroxiredoxin